MPLVLEPLSFAVGNHPVKDKSRALREWQVACLQAILTARRVLVDGPTGSGKSIAAKAQAAILLAQNPSLKHIVIIPQLVIESSYGSLGEKIDCTWPGVGKLEWLAGRKLTDGSPGSVAAIKDFALWRASGAVERRVLLCTHQAFVAAFAKLKGHKCWKNILLTIDEAHHSALEKNTYNRLGEVVSYFFEHDLRLAMFSATTERADFQRIIPAQYVAGKDYVVYTRPFWQHLDEMVHLKRVIFRFIVGRPEEAVTHLFKGKRPRKAIVWQPVPQSPITKVYGDKYKLLQTLCDAVGPAPEQDMEEYVRVHKSGKHTIRSLDLIWEQERKEVLRQLRCGEINPDILWCMNIGKEGFDKPDLEQALVIGPRGSMLDMRQMLGRLTRDEPGKHTIEFNVNLPSLEDDDPEAIRQYLNMILSSLLLGWNCGYQRRERVSEQIERIMEEDGPGLMEAALRAGLTAEGDEKAADVFQEEPEFAKYDKPVRATLARLMARLVSMSEAPDMGVAPIKQVFKGISTYALRLTNKSFKDLRHVVIGARWGASLVVTHPELAKQWHPTKNGRLRPEDVTAGQKLKIWWLGPCGHEFLYSPNDRLRTRTARVLSGGCPRCWRFDISDQEILTAAELLTKTTGVRILSGRKGSGSTLRMFVPGFPDRTWEDVAYAVSKRGSTLRKVLAQGGYLTCGLTSREIDTIPDLGLLPDIVLSEKYGITKAQVFQARQRHNIPSFRSKGGLKGRRVVDANIDWHAAGLGILSDKEVAQQTGMTVSLVAKRRRTWGKRLKVDWSAEPLLGKVPDHELASKYGLRRDTVGDARRRHKIPPHTGK